MHNSKCEPANVKIKNFDDTLSNNNKNLQRSISVTSDKTSEDHHNILRNQVYTDIKRRYEKEYSHIEYNICFYNINSIICSIPSCNHRVFNVTHNNILYLPIPPISPCSIYDCMNELFKREYMTDYKCENCLNTNGIFIDKSIVMHPKMIVIELTRYSSSLFHGKGSVSLNTGATLLLKKNDTSVDYPDILDITPYIYGNKEGIMTKATYKLIGVICHVGILHGGHYYAYCKNIDDDNWTLCNDTHISQVQLNEVLNSNNAYMLFYSCLD